MNTIPITFQSAVNHWYPIWSNTAIKEISLPPHPQSLSIPSSALPIEISANGLLSSSFNVPRKSTPKAAYSIVLNRNEMVTICTLFHPNHVSGTLFLRWGIHPSWWNSRNACSQICTLRWECFNVWKDSLVHIITSSLANEGWRFKNKTTEASWPSSKISLLSYDTHSVLCYCLTKWQCQGHYGQTQKQLKGIWLEATTQ